MHLLVTAEGREVTLASSRLVPLCHSHCYVAAEPEVRVINGRWEGAALTEEADS